MLKRIAAGVLTVSVLGAGGGAMIHQAQQADALPVAPPIVTPVAGDAGQNGAVNGQTAQNNVAAQNGVAVQNTEQTGEPVQAAQDNVGEPWQADGMLTDVDDFGFMLALADGTEAYVELGPPSYWQAQGVTLVVGDMVSVAGFSGDAGFHAREVTVMASGATIAVRNEAGQPLWSGGASNGQNGNASGAADGTHTQDPQAQVDEWVTANGVITEMVRSQMTLQTAEGELLTFQSGQPRFFETQGVAFAIGDEVEVLGFWQGDTFNAGDITNVATGERVMLRDPNGRPLWAGPGTSSGGGQSSGGTGGGNGYRGGQ